MRVSFALLAVTVALQSVPSAAADTKPCEIRMRNGSYFKGMVRGLGTVSLRTKYAVMEIPLADVKSIRLGDVEKEERDTVVTAEATFTGWLDSWEEVIEVNTGYGTLKIPIKEAKSLEFLKELKGSWSMWPEPVEGKPSDETAFLVRLKEGMSFRGGLIGVSEVSFKTKYAVLEVPLKEVKSLSIGGKTDSIKTAEGPFDGTLVSPDGDFSLETGFGVLTLPRASVTAVHQVTGNGGFGDDFESETIDGWTSYGGAWKTSGGRLEIAGGNNYNTVVLFNEALPETYSLEVDCRGNAGLGILWNAQSQSAANALWISNNLVYVLGGGSWWNWQQTAQWTATIPANESYRVRLDVKGEEATVYINDVALGTVNTGTRGGKVGLFCFTGSASFDNFWVR